MVQKWLVCSAFLLVAKVAIPCATVWSVGTNGNNITASESAILVWDRSKKTETFIRQAEFQTSANDMGFLVPTPSTPILREADPLLFEKLRRAVNPVERATLNGYKFVFLSAEKTKATEAATSAPKPEVVRILGTQQVAGYLATTLSSENSAALAVWLSRNGFEMRPALKKWLEFYSRQKWVLTAFKYQKKPHQTNIVTPPISLEFKTPLPIYPYREPDDSTANPDRSLRLFVISDVAFNGKIDGKTWATKPEYAFFLPTSVFGADPTFKKISSANRFLTTFYDRATTRHGLGDIKFVPDYKPTYNVPAPRIVTNDQRVEIGVTLWLPVLAILLFGLSSGIVKFRKMWHEEDAYETGQG